MVVMFSTVVSFINKCSFRSYKFYKVDTFSSKLTTLAWDSLIFRSLSSKLEFIYPLWAWGVGEQMLISSSCLTPGRVKGLWNSVKHLKSTSVRHLIALFEITTRSHHWATAQTREWGSRSNMASDSVRSGPTNYEDSTPEWASDTFAIAVPTKTRFYASRIHVLKRPSLQLARGCQKSHVIYKMGHCFLHNHPFWLPLSFSLL